LDNWIIERKSRALRRFINPPTHFYLGSSVVDLKILILKPSSLGDVIQGAARPALVETAFPRRGNFLVD
jgi:hypothetical protein